MHSLHRGGILSSFSLFLTLPQSFLSARRRRRPCLALSFFRRSIFYRYPRNGFDEAKTFAAPATRRRITGRVVIIRHCRVMIRECARPLLYAFFLLSSCRCAIEKAPTEVVDGLTTIADLSFPPLPLAATLTSLQLARRGVKGLPVRDQ